MAPPDAIATCHLGIRIRVAQRLGKMADLFRRFSSAACARTLVPKVRAGTVMPDAAATCCIKCRRVMPVGVEKYMAMTSSSVIQDEFITVQDRPPNILEGLRRITLPCQE